MKRCPRCEFVYENEQSRCDMDGTGLVYDPRPLAPEGSAGSGATQPTALLVKSSVVGVLFVLVLLLGYYGFTRRIAPSNISPSPSKLTIAPQSDPPIAPLPAATQTPTPSPAWKPTPPKKSSGKISLLDTVSPVHSSSVRKRQGAWYKPIRAGALAKNQPRQGIPASTNAKKDSRISALLKKTARVLKKPFDF